MAEFIITGYKRLFEVHIVQHYFLDDGMDDFQAPFILNDSPEVRNAKLQKREKNWGLYDIRKVLRVTPTPKTEIQIGKLGGIFRLTATGFLIAVPATASVPSSARFDFAMTVTDSNFYQYTGLPFFKNSPDKIARNQKIVEVRHDQKAYRFKTNVFVFSNNHGGQSTIRNPMGSVPFRRFFLTREISEYLGTETYLAESVVRHNDALFRAMRDKPGAPPSTQWQKLNISAVITDPDDPAYIYSKLPGYVTQNDIPDITALPGVAGVPAKGIELTEDLPNEIFALIQMEAMPPLADFQLLSGGQLREPHPVFYIHFKNRATYWRYFSKNQKKYLELPASPPRNLTAFGNAMTTVNSGMPKPRKPYPIVVEVFPNAGGDLLKMYTNVQQTTSLV